MPDRPLVGYAQMGMKDVEVIEVVRTRLLRRGEGVKGDPIRIVTQYWTPAGELLAEVDEWAASEDQRMALRAQA